MASFPDLSPCTYFGNDPGEPLLAVGWLERGDTFPTGSCNPPVYDRLVSLSQQPWQPCAAAGWHACTVCQVDGPRGKDNLFIPGDRVIYVCPALIVHYISAHWYLPPDEFCSATLQCPDMSTMEYKRAFVANGGRSLLRDRSS